MCGRYLPLLGALIPLFLFPVLATSAAAEDLSPDTAADCAIAARFVNGKLDTWQQRLNLKDWKISVLISHPRDLKPKTLGNIHWDAGEKTAVIRVLSPSDYQLSCHDALNDMEFTIVHELIHLELSSLPRSEASRRDEEYAVNHITAALLQLERGQ